MPSKRYRLATGTWTVCRERHDPSPRSINDPESAARLALELVRDHDDDKEHFWVVMLNTINRFLLLTEVTMGTQSAALVHPREVFGPALREGAASIIAVHNHPSGDPTPSREDLDLTKRLTEAGRLLEVPLHDHVIVGNGSGKWISLAQQGVV